MFSPAHYATEIVTKLAQNNILLLLIDPDYVAKLSPLDAENGVNRLLKPLIHSAMSNAILKQVLSPIGINLAYNDAQSGGTESDESMSTIDK